MRNTAKALTISVLAAMLGAAAPSPVDRATAALVARSLADPARAAQRTVDARRHPAELVALAQLRPGQRVLDLIPGDGYWSRIFSKIVGASGRVYAVWPEPYAKLAARNVEQLRAMSASKDYANVTTLVQPGATLHAPEALDAIWTVQNYHDYNDPFMGSPGSLSFARSAYALLKPGGIFVVVDHAAATGHGLSDTDKLHRIEREAVIREARTAGFALVGESTILRNPRDPLSVAVFDPSIRGHTSQFALKFRKPLR